jgi:hypothetical protein
MADYRCDLFCIDVVEEDGPRGFEDLFHLPDDKGRIMLEKVTASGQVILACIDAAESQERGLTVELSKSEHGTIPLEKVIIFSRSIIQKDPL